MYELDILKCRLFTSIYIIEGLMDRLDSLCVGDNNLGANLYFLYKL